MGGKEAYHDLMDTHRGLINRHPKELSPTH
jgi:hypothetical protein